MAEELVARAEKACTRCCIVKQADDFFRQKAGKGCGLGLQARCKACQRDLVQEWRVKNKDKISAKMKAAYWANPEAVRAKRNAANRENREACREQGRRSYAKHREKRRASVNAYNAANLEEVRRYRRNYYQAKIANDPAKKVRLRMRSRLRAAVKDLLIAGKMGRGFEPFFGYTPQDLVDHLVSKFQHGMTVEDLLAGKIHIDHIRPVSAFNATSLDCPELKACWALDNLQPLWAKDNLSKGARLTWSPVHDEAVAGDPAHSG